MEWVRKSKNMDIVIIIANVLSFIGNSLFTLSAILKSKRKILLFQSSNHVLAIVAEFLTAAYSGMVQEGVSLIRNIFFLFAKIEKKLIKFLFSLLFLAISVVFGILFNIWFSEGVWYGYLPTVGAFIYSSFVILAFMLNISELQGEFLLKVGLALNSICWGVYGYFVKLYPIMIFNAINFVLCIVSFVRIYVTVRNKKRELEKKETEEISE